MTYRKEIDGLRAVAVLPVILFHAGAGLFPGGFAGVDVFFVISGFLITSNIVAERSAGEFSFLRFYERRARRILPALYVVMLASIPFAWIWMLPDNLENFGQSVLATTTFANNALLWLTSGYFDLESEFKPLIHTWSLGVEEQYYLIFPILFGILWKCGRSWVLRAAAIAAGISILAASWLQNGHPKATFYLLPFRIWELLLGVCAALLATGRHAGFFERARERLSGRILSVLGLCMIGIAVFVYHRETPFLGFPALLPVGGAALVLLFAGKGNLAGRLLGTRFFVGIGMISYSAYLWHQPIFAFARLRSLHEPGPGALLALGAGALVLAYPTWKFVEQPFRKKGLLSSRQFLAFALIPGVLLIAFGLIVHLNSGFPLLWAELRTEVQAAGRGLNAEYNKRPFAFQDLPFKDPALPNVLVLGNSFARDVINAGMENGRFVRQELSYSPWVPEGLRDLGDIPSALRTRIADADIVILGSPPTSLRTWPSDARILAEAGARRIVVIGTKNFGWNMNAVMLLPAETRYSYSADVLPSHVRENLDCRRVIPPEQYVDLLELLAGRDGRVPVFTEERKLISQDRQHLTKDGAKYVGKRLFQHPLLRDLQ